MGNVLIKYKPELYLDRAGISEVSDRKLLLENIFHSSGWREMDMGTLDEKGMYLRTIHALPQRLHGVAYELIFARDKPLIPVEGMYELVEWCKSRGLDVYLLSNASIRQPEYWETIEIRKYFDGAVVSALEKCMKPAERLYRILLERYGLKAEECLFIDDAQANVEGALAVGMKGWHFRDDPEKLKEHIIELTE